ncbi:uncharacterized protein PV06_07618 [Exophiala oligosperma]|uniref:Enoyl-CoA hydratase n=1 Tax=Exophiala oligosperma TaxID=215243 RepID=A0A0D2AK03_9EURO|nr:uncharacterized protein PV06_07618 [Exophiala oligosperma]KIW40416.1 hypothetical protein PV06_07618 [Exophiala oligosperma]
MVSTTTFSLSRMGARFILRPLAPTSTSKINTPSVRYYAASSSSTSSSGSDSPIKVLTHPAPHNGHIKILLLDRPASRNALSRRLITDLRSQISRIQSEHEAAASRQSASRSSTAAADPTRALILASSNDKAFCAGADLVERRGMTAEETRTFLSDMRSTFAALSSLPIPTVSAVSSVALGGGLEIALCTTFRVFATTAVVGQPETKLGIIPGAGGTYRLPALVGPNRARDLILTGRRVSGEEAYFLGLCNRLVQVEPREDATTSSSTATTTTTQEGESGLARKMVLDASLDLARQICEGGPIAVTQAMRAIDGWTRGEASENEAYEVVLATEDRLEALKAFGEKRKPVFKGR